MQRFTFEATVGAVRLILVECLAGGPEQGIYLAAVPSRLEASPPPPANYLITSALAPDDLEGFRQQVWANLLLFVPGIAPLHAIVPLESFSLLPGPSEGTLPVAVPSLIGIVETCPAGLRSHEWLVLPLPSPTAARVALQVARALAYAHAMGFGVGGIRPESIYLSGPMQSPHVSGIAPRAERFWQLLPRPDFGVAPAYRDTYDAPELLGVNADADPTPASDVFSLSATLAYWLTGAHPFEGETLTDQILAIRRGRRAPLLPRDGPTLRVWSGLEQLVNTGLAQDPASRPQIGDWITALQALVTPEPTVSPDDAG